MSGHRLPTGHNQPGRFLVVTADDFGLHSAVNEAVEIGCREGIVQAASLMVGAAAAGDAVRRARALPRLRVGLHLVLADGVPSLPAGEIDALIDASGRFRNSQFSDGLRYFVSARARGQLEREIRAQFRAFAATGLALDHVNAHKHFHLHPTLLGMILRIGRDYGLAAMRWPHEPSELLPGSGGRDRIAAVSLAPWLALMRARLRRAGIAHNDQLFGIRDSGRMEEPLLLELLERLPPGLSEIYLHPATRSGAQIAASMAGYRHALELEALCSGRVCARLAQLPVRCGGYTDWLALRAGSLT